MPRAAIPNSARRSAPALTTLLMMVLALTSLLGCGGGSRAEPEEAAPEKTAEEIAAERLALREERARKAWRHAKDRRRKNPESFEDNQQNFSDSLISAKGFKFQKDVEATIEELQTEFEKFAMDQLTKLYPKVDSLVKEGDFVAAESVLDNGFNMRRFHKLPAYKAFEDKRGEIALYSLAESDMFEATRTARAFANQEQPAKAVAILEAYSDRYESTPYYKDVKSKIPEYYKKYKDGQAEVAAKHAVAWADVEIDDFLSEFDVSDADVFTGSGSSIEGDNKSEKTASLIGGDKKWLEYYVEMEVMLGGEQTDLVLGIHQEFILARKRLEFEIHRIALEPGEWHKIRIEVEAGEVAVIDPEEGEYIYQEKASLDRGGWAVFLMPGESLSIRNVKVKLLKEDKTSKAEGEEGDDE